MHDAKLSVYSECNSIVHEKASYYEQWPSTKLGKEKRPINIKSVLFLWHKHSMRANVVTTMTGGSFMLGKIGF